MELHFTACLLGRTCMRQRASLHNTLTTHPADIDQGGMRKACGDVHGVLQKTSGGAQVRSTEVKLNTCMRCTFYTRSAAVGIPQRFVK
jgi:hypothetical protein